MAWAAVNIVLIFQNQIPLYRNVINKAMDYIARNMANNDDIYSLALTSYALQLAQHNSKDYILQTFDSRATLQGISLVLVLWPNLDNLSIFIVFSN